MKKFSILLSLIFVSFINISCADIFTKYENYVTELKFEGSNYTVEKNEIVALTLSANPSDSFQFYEPEYSISDETICGVIDKEGRQIFVKGYEKGTVIITAKLSNQITKCVVKVMEN